MSCSKKKNRYQPRSPADGPWFWVNRDRAQVAVAAGGAQAMLVYCGLCLSHSRAGGADTFKASRSNLAHATGLSARSIDRSLLVLEKAGLVDRRSGRYAGQRGAHVMTAWVLLHPAGKEVRK